MAQAWLGPLGLATSYRSNKGAHQRRATRFVARCTRDKPTPLGLCSARAGAEGGLAVVPKQWSGSRDKTGGESRHDSNEQEQFARTAADRS